MALTTTTIFLTLAAGAGYKFFEAMRDYRKLQAETGNHGNLFREMPDSPQLGGVKFDFKLSGVCAAGAVVALLGGMMFSGSPKVVEVANAKPVELKGTVQPAAKPAPAPVAQPVTTVAAPATAPDDAETCTKQMELLAMSACVNNVHIAAGSERAIKALTDVTMTTAKTCGRWNAQPYINASTEASKPVIAAFFSGNLKVDDIFLGCYRSVKNTVGDYRIQPK